jgi:hypothetical protein
MDASEHGRHAVTNYKLLKGVGGMSIRNRAHAPNSRAYGPYRLPAFRRSALRKTARV